MVTLKVGSNSNAVTSLQRYLNVFIHGTKLLKEDGSFGNGTREVLNQFKAFSKLPQDGIYDAKTRDALILYIRTILSEKKVNENAIVRMLSRIHTRELSGKNDGKDVELFLKSVGLGTGYAWCQAFVYWGYKEACVISDVGNPMKKTAGVLDNFNSSKDFQVKSPKRGDIFVMDFGQGKGHSGLIYAVEGKHIYTVEGNTTGSFINKELDRNGQGVFIRQRLISSITGFLRYGSI